MKTTLMIASGLAALSLAACSQPADETATSVDDATMAAGDSAMDASDSAMAAANGSADTSNGAAMSSSNGGGATSSTSGSTGARSGSTGGRASGSQTMDPSRTTSTSGAPMTGSMPTTQETVAATRGTLSPGGASSGATAPPPQ